MATDEELRDEEDAVTRTVDAVLREIAAEIARELEAADEITAAAFSLRRIGELWRAGVPRILRRLFRVGQRAAGDTADAVLEGQLPEGFDRLEERYEEGNLPPAMAAYRDQTTALLEAVGERIAQDAARELAEGLALGEDTDALRARLLAVLSRDGTQLGESRARRIAATETTRAWNAAADATVLASELPPGTVLTKTWRTREDNRVREAHAEVDRTSVPAAGVFQVGGYSMRFPGDPTAPASLTVNCRCVLDYERQETASVTAATDPTGESMDEDEVTTEHTGAMIALVPTQADAERIALSGDGALPSEELHLTLVSLGEAADWSDEARASVLGAIGDWAAGSSGPVPANLFGVALWNPGGDYPAWVWQTGDDEGEGTTLTEAHVNAYTWTEDVAPDLVPEQHTPFVAHVTGASTTDTWPLEEMTTRLGPVTFDRVRVAFAGEYTDFPLGTPAAEEEVAAADAPLYPVRTWSTPGDAALAFENEKTGDGRLFAPGALYWDGAGPWPLQYCDRMGMGHDGAALAGGIQNIERDGGRIAGNGVLYMTQNAGWEAATLLDQNAPLGVSVDLDDVTVDMVDHAVTEGEEDVVEVEFSRLSVMAASGGGWIVSGTVRPVVTASASGVARSSRTVEFTASADGGLGRSVALAVLGRELTAAAGDEDTGDAPVYTESPDDYTMRIMRGRLRGATLVPIPAFAGARIVIDPPEDAEPEPADLVQEDMDLAASDEPAFSATASRVVAHVRSTPGPITPAEVAEALQISVVSARRHLRDAAAEGKILRHGRHYISATIPEGEILASVIGDTGLPVHPDGDAEWNGDAAMERVFQWATAEDGAVDVDRVQRAFLYQDAEADPQTKAAYKLGFADVFDGELHIVPRGVYAVAGALEGARGGVDVPEEDVAALRERTEDLYEAVGEALGDDELRAPWDREDDEMTASAWTAMQDLPPMPAAWFREPTAEELPPGSGGVRCEGGRVFGWVAQRGVPHAVHGRSVTIEKLAGTRGLDYSHFLRQRFTLDDGSEVRAGAFTMNVGHHRDGFECETAACQFDDSRTVAAVVTVGLNEGGLWFSGAAGPWLSDWDRRAFAVCQPSYHMTQNPDGRWALKAVLSVPVPGHSSPLVASVIDRANLALTASAWMAGGDHVQAEAAALAATIGLDGPDHKKES